MSDTQDSGFARIYGCSEAEAKKLRLEDWTFYRALCGLGPNNVAFNKVRFTWFRLTPKTHVKITERENIIADWHEKQAQQTKGIIDDLSIRR